MARAVKNILFVMYDQLRWDYLSCAGHPHLHTPNFDRVAAMGVRFDRAYVQSTICGSSRMSYYTGRYAQSHGAEWNGFPLRVGEKTLGDHLRAVGMDCYLIGKTHMRADEEGMQRLGVDPDSIIGVRASECGFDPWVRDDGMVPEGPDGSYDGRVSPYNEWLKEKGYPGPNPWSHYANSGIKDGQIAPAWILENADLQANIREEDSETPWLTDRALEFMDQQPGPWCAHLSYIKPHWPYIAPAPYHDMFGANQVPAPTRDARELDNDHPVYSRFARSPIGKSFQDDEARAKVIQAYMGLIKQCDDQLGRVLDRLEQTGAIEHTMVVLTSDHGDYLGDHWMGEKMFMHEQSVRVPMIVYDPREAADATRGTVSEALVEAIDLAPTFVEAAGGAPEFHWLEGRSLAPLLHGAAPSSWRDAVISEYNYAATPLAGVLGLSDEDARIFMVFDGRWKLIHFEGGIRPMLFDLQSDPDEFEDLGARADHAAEIERMYGHLNAWGRRQSQQVTVSKEKLDGMRGSSARRGILLGVARAADADPELFSKYVGPAQADYTKE
ncbi:Sulfatase family protein [Candidatus Rhodobacter oscarellae]|uniref:Sulfatase family protein n=1 Tax=Candidatus Rhodobacter oscarellae TaxID=1675527 RepID=A0A0J9E5D7_9RHOB|nr:sulfatase-like hydrolase/transferase [Candidatus Rhodobacter lobularis]KMW57985.1 Sulfatase family protein [Candidatus Rhodobacter lobularis]